MHTVAGDSVPDHCSCHTSSSQLPLIMCSRKKTVESWNIGIIFNFKMFKKVLIEMKQKVPMMRMILHLALHNQVNQAYYCCKFATWQDKHYVILEENPQRNHGNPGNWSVLYFYWTFIYVLQFFSIQLCIPCITINSKFKLFSVHIVGQVLHSWWECWWICNKVTL